MVPLSRYGVPTPLLLGPPFSKKKINWPKEDDKETMKLTGNSSTQGGGGIQSF
jgi:predicted outer membrane repeat protein